nr:hypothetical protein [Tanacetum cinerariifolium]
MDTFPRSRNDKNTRQFMNQRTVTVAEAMETITNQVVQQTWIQCFNCKEFGHMAKECKKPKRVKDYAYHKEKMLLRKKAEKGVPLSAYQGDWLDDIDEETDKHELEAHYLYMAKIQGVSTAESGPTFVAEPLEKIHTVDAYNVFANDQEHTDQPKNMNDTSLVETLDSNTTQIHQMCVTMILRMIRMLIIKMMSVLRLFI